MSRMTLRELRERRGKVRGKMHALIRRMAVVAHDAAEWILESGYEDADGNPETEVAEPFGVAGVYSRLATQAIVAQVGAADGHAVIIATSNRDLLALLAGGIAAGEAGMCNEQVALRLRPDGTIEAASHGGAGVALATLADVVALRNYIQTQLTLPVDGDTAGPIAAPVAPAPSGTTVLRGE